ncbi:unnamed protein product, partial [Gongylonema pulchrum]|uniref:PepSY domain-containing protein n=1 Tax=Gongylonema pulchrum TaxID=637853 RepID=A0A183EPF3_9BILA
MEDISASELHVIDKSLPEPFYTAKRMAFPCRLCDVMPVAGGLYFDAKAREEFSRLTADELCVTFLRQSVKGVYEVTVQQKDGRSVADLLISRGFAVPFKWGIGPPLPSYE